jgi:putative phage-type endonuclease
MKRITHNLAQGSPEWHAYRAQHDNASDAAAMMGLSNYETRDELIRRYATGITPEHDARTLEIFANGHRVESLVRPLAEANIGEELYPVVMSYGKLSASCDGLTADGLTAFECKQWNQSLADSLRNGVLPNEYWPQVHQVMGVSGAGKCLFVCSDGTPDKYESLLVFFDQQKFNALMDGWYQFEIDVSAYVPKEVIQHAVAAPVMALPTVTITVSGAVALTSNLADFHQQLQAFLKRIPAKPSTDQEFADCKAAVKTLKDSEDALDAAEIRALGQVASFDDMRRAKALCFDLSRQTRLALERLVVARETQIKSEIVAAGRLALAAHVERLDTMLGHYYMPSITDRFVEVIKSKRTVAALQNAVNTELARLKIEADAISRTIQANINTMESDGKEHAMLFPDLKALVIKNPDDFQAMVWLRISEQKAAEAKREKIRKEEQDKLAAETKAAAQTIQMPDTGQSGNVRPSSHFTTQESSPVAAAPIDDGSIFNAILRVIDDFSQCELQQALDAVRKIKAARS